MFCVARCFSYRPGEIHQLSQIKCCSLFSVLTFTSFSSFLLNGVASVAVGINHCSARVDRDDFYSSRMYSVMNLGEYV